jgi:hypothetical protein
MIIRSSPVSGTGNFGCGEFRVPGYKNFETAQMQPTYHVCAVAFPSFQQTDG